MVTNEELKKVYGMFTDVWKLYRRFADIQQLEGEGWQQFVHESDVIAKRYNNGRLIRDLLLETTQELERQSKNVEKNETV